MSSFQRTAVTTAATLISVICGLYLVHLGDVFYTSYSQARKMRAYEAAYQECSKNKTTRFGEEAERQRMERCITKMTAGN